MSGYAATSDARKRIAEAAALAALEPTPGTVRVGKAVVPALRSVHGDVTIEHMGAWHTVSTFVALTFREKVPA